MKKVFVHGLGQRADSWGETISALGWPEAPLCPDLAALLRGRAAEYEDLRAAFADYCNGLDDGLDLCGISLGGILALQYALDCPDRVASLVLIGTPCKMPRAMLGVQSLIFRLMPEAAFAQGPFGKADTRRLTGSMKRLDLSDQVRAIRCRALVLCGEKDRANQKAARFLAGQIPGASMQLVARAGHAVNEEAPKALAGILRALYGA